MKKQLIICWYCGSKLHEDTPCPQRVKDANRFVELGKKMYKTK